MSPRNMRRTPSIVVRTVPERKAISRARAPPVTSTTRKSDGTSRVPKSAPTAANSLTSPAPIAPKRCSPNIRAKASAHPPSAESRPPPPARGGVDDEPAGQGREDEGVGDAPVAHVVIGDEGRERQEQRRGGRHEPPALRAFGAWPPSSATEGAAAAAASRQEA